jgi:hypothetical protein
MATQGNATSGSAVSSLMGVMGSAKEKWDQSGANDAMARMSASLPQGTKEYISLTSSQLFNRQHLRSMTVYFGVGEEKPFYLERNPALLLARVKHNVSFFYLNYLMFTAVLFCLTLLISPSAIIGIGLLGLAWTYVIRQTQNGSLRIGGVMISQTHATIGMGIVSMFVLLYLLSGIFWWTLFSSGFLVAVHACLRDASMHQDGDDKVDMVGEVGEDAAFLGANSNPV